MRKTKLQKQMNEDLRRIQEISLVEILRPFVKLRKSGKNYFGLCPLHKEDSESFAINPELNRFKCFGCGAYGDLIEFLKLRHNIPFAEAFKKAREMANVYYSIHEDCKKRA